MPSQLFFVALHSAQNLRKRKLLVTTEMLDNAVAALAMTGESSQPVNG